VKKQNLFLLYFLFLSGTLAAQGFRVSGKIVNEKDSVPNFADIFLLNKNSIV